MSDEDAPRPSFGGGGFKRKNNFAPPGNRKHLKTDGNASPLTAPGKGGKMTFAQKMMAKMGYKAGEGLGKEGGGIINPIEVKLRPQGAGVGAVKEKTEQHKAEERRRREAAGEKVSEDEDSEEEERRARKKRREKREGMSGGGAAGGRRKTKFKTVEDVRAAAPGLEVPKAMLSSIVDATAAGEAKLLTSAAGLMRNSLMVPQQTEEEKIRKREALELNAFIEAWHGLQERKIVIEEHEGQLALELQNMMDEVERMRKLVQEVEGLAITRMGGMGDDETERSAWDERVTELETLQDDCKHEIESQNLSEAAVAALHPLFKVEMEDWDPLLDPAERLVQSLTTLRPILGLEKTTELAAGNNHIDPALRRYRRQKTTTPYETLIYSVWLPKMRSTMNDWDVHNPQPIISVVKSWRPLLPPFVYSNLMDQLIIPRLTTALTSWNPRVSKHRHRAGKSALPHLWLFPWLPYLPPYHLDQKAATGLLSDVKRKFRALLDTCDLEAGVLPGLSEWRALLKSEIDSSLIRHLLPRLAKHLSTKFTMDPSDQDVKPLEQVLAWGEFFTPAVMARLFIAEFFPKWLAVLHLWLGSDNVNYEEIGQWYTWWKTQLPASIHAQPDVNAQWTKGLEMINKALDLEEQGRSMAELPAPAAGPARPIAKDPGIQKRLKEEQEAQARKKEGLRQQEEVSFEDVVETWCAEEDVMLVPLREAHTATGFPLFRLTASTTGKGGVVVYFKGDIIWAEKKGDRGTFDPVGLDKHLLARAEGR